MINSKYVLYSYFQRYDASVGYSNYVQNGYLTVVFPSLKLGEHINIIQQKVGVLGEITKFIGRTDFGPMSELYQAIGQYLADPTELNDEDLKFF